MIASSYKDSARIVFPNLSDLEITSGFRRSGLGFTV